LKQFITLCDNGVTVGGLRVNLNVLQSAASTSIANAEAVTAGGKEAADNEEENEDIDVDEAMLHSIDYRDHEISR
jgi:hypothetical protein